MQLSGGPQFPSWGGSFEPPEPPLATGLVWGLGWSWGKKQSWSAGVEAVYKRRGGVRYLHDEDN